MLAQAPSLAATGEAPEAEVAPLAAQAAACADPRIGLQALGLLAHACPGARRAWSSAMEAFAARAPRGTWETRMDVLSVAEALSST
jgi:hypothetical protein